MSRDVRFLPVWTPVAGIFILLVALLAGGPVPLSHPGGVLAAPRPADDYRVLLPAVFAYTPAYTETRVIIPGVRFTSLLFEPNAPAHGYAHAEYPANNLLETVDGGQIWTTVSVFPGLRYITMHPITHTVLYAIGSTTVRRSTDAGRTWEGLGLGAFGGPLSGLGVHPVSPTILLVGAHTWEPGLYNGQIFRSTDNGQSWNVASAPYANAQTFAFDPLTPTLMYAGSTSNGVLKSTDNGAWWQPANNGINPWVSELVPATETPGLVYAAARNGVYVSYDRADHWQVLWAGPAVWALARDPRDSRALYAGTAHGIYVSYNAGGDWYPLGPCAAGTGVNRLVFSPLSPSVLWAATDDGLWECRSR